MIFRNHITSSSAWETLKSRGVDLISDDTLRLRVMEFYQADDALIKLWNSVDHELVYNSVRPYYRTHFTHDGSHGPQTRTRPLQYSQVAHDPQLAYILAERHDTLEQALAGYAKAKQDAVWIMAEIDRRIRALG